MASPRSTLPPAEEVQLSSFGGQKFNTQRISPANLSQLQLALTLAREKGQHVVFRAGGRALDTQSLNDVYVIALDAFNSVCEPDLEARTITVGASASWGDILKKTAAHGLVPYVMVTSSGATAGGTLSADCLSRFSPSCGKEGAHIRSFKFMRMVDSQIVRCSRNENHEEFKAIISGLGCLGPVYEITYDLMQFPYASPDLAVGTTITPFAGIDDLAQRLVNHVAESQVALADAHRANGAEPQNPHAASTTIAAARACPDQVEAIYAVLYLNKARQGLLVRSRYQERPAKGLKPTFLHQPRSFRHLAAQLGSLLTWTRRIGWWVTLKWVFPPGTTKTYTDELFDFTFFQNGNERIKRVGRRFWLPLGTRQQTFIVPWDPADRIRSGEGLAQFLNDADKLLDSRGLLPALIDVLYVPDDANEGFLFSSSRELSGFAVTFTFEKVFSTKFAKEERALREIARLLPAGPRGGRVHLVKHVFADTSLLEDMYGASVDSMIVRKAELDPNCTIRSDFLLRIFPRLFAKVRPE